MDEFKSAQEEHDYYEAERFNSAYVKLGLDNSHTLADMMRKMMTELKGKCNPVSLQEFLMDMIRCTP